MNRFIVLLYAACALAAFVAVPCPAATGEQSQVQERIVDLPQDQDKWYVSVVGDSTSGRYREVLGWFDSNAGLKKLKNQVHFCPVTTNTSIYKNRYASNTSSLPMVRVQRGNGEVIFEVMGVYIPSKADDLYGLVAKAVNEAQSIRPVLPWRREMEKRLQPQPAPKPDSKPQPDPEPQPLDNNGPPNMSEPEPEAPAMPPWLLALLINGGLILGVGVGYVFKLTAKIKAKR
jgi:hypothetical protein